MGSVLAGLTTTPGGFPIPSSPSFNPKKFVGDFRLFEIVPSLVESSRTIEEGFGEVEKGSFGGGWGGFEFVKRVKGDKGEFEIPP